ncbi:MAG: hypothetical protein GXY20_01210 [Clostridiales bacterium]|nr:hypothetical protein [Clostridiales bacterium]
MSITPKENLLMMYRREIPEYIPSMFEPSQVAIKEEMLTPVSAPDGPIVTALGVEYIGSKDLMNGAMPTPGKILLRDITKWRDVIKKPDTSGRDWEGYYKNQTKNFDREKFAVSVPGGADYFLTLVSFMGFENAFLALYEEPEEVKALLEYVSEYYIEVMKHQLYYVKPDIYGIMDDDAAYRAPFMSLSMYREFFKPFHKKHADLALENGCYLDRHDCGRCEQYIDDWLEIGIRSWNSAQITNDLRGIKKKYGNRLIMGGGWDMLKYGNTKVDMQEFKDSLVEYVDTFAPGGGFNFFAHVSGPPDDPKVKERSDYIKSFYYDYVKDWYKTH